MLVDCAGASAGPFSGERTSEMAALRRLIGPSLFACAALLAACDGRAPHEQERASNEAALVDFSLESGLEFQHFVDARGERRLPEIMGSGVGLIDYDGDGDLDVYLIQGAPGPGNQLFRNELSETGTLRFVDVTATAGLGRSGYGMGVAVGDYDNDGDPDLFVTNFGPNALYRNNGDGTFSDATAGGLDDPRWSTSASFLDYDNDGDLDLFFSNYVDFTLMGNKECFDAAGMRDYCSPKVYRSVPDRLFRNDGGRFSDVSAAAGLGAAFGNGLGVTAADFNGDNLQDIYVANDGTDNQLWMNLGGGRFENTALMAGAAYNADGIAEAGMGVSAADFDNDGDEDLFMTHLTLETNTLYLNDGAARFLDITNRAGLGAASMRFTGFGMQWFDYDNDGLLDLFIANGAVTAMESRRGEAYPFQQTNQLFQGLGGGRFEERSQGDVFEIAEVSRGAAFGDLDQDGDVDIVVSNNNGPARVLLNQAAGGRWLRVRVEGREASRDGFGARVALLSNGKATMWRRIHTDGSYLSACEAVAHFGLGSATAVEAVGVIWPGGARERFGVAGVDQMLMLRQGEGEDWL